MHKLLALIVVVPIVLMGCSKDPKERLQGTWQGVQCLNCDDMDAKEAAAWAQTLVFAFEQDALTVSVGTESSRQGKFEITEAKGDNVTLRIKDAESDKGVFHVRFKGKDLIANMGEKRDFLMKRKK